MSKTPTRKKVTAHRRGEHHEGNLVWARRGCPLCAADVAAIQQRTAEHIEEAARSMYADRSPEEQQQVIDKVKDLARAEGFL